MPDDIPATPPPAAPTAAVLLEPVKVLAAVADPVRHGIVRLLSGGAVLSVTELASALGRAPDLISKHLLVLREARLLMPVKRPGEDGRKLFHEVPSVFRVQDAAGRPAVDYGTVLLRF